MEKGFVKNTINVAISNLVIVLSGVVTGLILPKILGVTNYGLYKIFNLYTTYVIFFDVGISNGIYLYFGGYRSDELPKEKMRMVFKVFAFINVIFSLLILFSAMLFMNSDYRFIFILLSIHSIANNIAVYCEKISVMCGDFFIVVRRNYLKSILSIVIVGLLWIIMKCNFTISPYKIYTILFVLMYIIIAVQYLLIYKKILFGKCEKFSENIDFMKSIIKTGAVLLVADTISSLILNLDRQFVSSLFSIEEYSLYAFAYSMLKIVVLAISAISTVLYPTLKRMKGDEIKKSYQSSIILVGMISFACLLLYYPLALIVEIYLPAYTGSLLIFRLLFPGISVNCIISMVMINHYKVLQMQKNYFYISLLVLASSAIANYASYLIIGKPFGFTIASFLTIMIWYIISDIILKKYYSLRSLKEYIYILSSTAIFYLISFEIPNCIVGFLINTISFMLVTFVIYPVQSKKLCFQLTRCFVKR